MFLFSLLVAVPPGLFLAIALWERRSHRSVRPTLLATVWLAAAGGVTAVVLLTLQPWRWDSVGDALTGALPLAVALALVGVHLQHLVWAIRLDRSTKTYRISQMTASAYVAESITCVRYDYGHGLKGRAPASGRHRHSSRVVALAGNPAVHRLVPGRVPEGEIRARRRSGWFALGTLAWAAVAVAIALWLHLTPLAGTALTLAGVLLAVIVVLPRLERRH